MVDVDNIVKWLPLTFLVFAVFTVISVLYIGGLTDVTNNIGEYDRGKFRIGVVMENTLTVSDKPGSAEVDYDHRRGAIPKKFFTNQLSEGESDEIGYAINGGKCYIPRVAGLDGENFGFYLLNQDSLGDDDASTKCGQKIQRPHATARLTAVSEDTKFHNDKEIIRMSIYEIE